jgi:hypothetical protein
MQALRDRFAAAKRTELLQHLEALPVLGLVRQTDDGSYVAAKVQVASAA